LDNFPVLSGGIIVVAATALGLLYLNSVRSDLTDIAERNNVALTRAFANVIWPEIASFVPMAGALSRQELRRHPKISDIRTAALSTMRDVPVLKIKLFDLNGLTVFSTDPAQIGEDKGFNAGFSSARQGRVASELTHRGKFSAFEQVVENRDVLSSYIPIRAADGSVQAVFEIYYDVTALLLHIKRTQHLQIGVVALTFLVLYFIIIQLVRHRERLAREHHLEQLRLSRKVIAAEQASNTKSAILANMSHELLTPLNAILGFADVMRLQQQGPLGSRKYLEYVDDILKSGRHVLSIVANVLDLSKVESGEARLNRESAPLVPMVEECIMLAAARHASCPTVRRDFSPECATLHVDVGRFRQILISLLSNAIKYTPPDGNITVRSQAATDGGIVISITDTGKGMEPDKVATALTPFGRDGEAYIRRSEGLGLGLPLAQSFVQLHGGTMHIDSAPDKGTFVEIRLPASCLAQTASIEATTS
jgi:signal transduction histidine kinase